MPKFIIDRTELHSGLEFLQWSCPEDSHVIWVVYLKQVWEQTIIYLIGFVIDTSISRHILFHLQSKQR